MKSRINDRLSLNFITLELASCIFESFIKEWENYQNRYFFKVFKIQNNFRCFCLFVLLKCSYFILKAKILVLASVAQLLGTSSHTLKVAGSISIRAHAWVAGSFAGQGDWVGRNLSISFCYINISFSLSLSPHLLVFSLKA